MKRALIYGSMVMMTSVTSAQIQFSDGDGDGVSDFFDACPEAAETQNGFQDRDGCPDEESAALDALAQRVFFRTGRDTLDGRARGTVSEIAGFLASHDEIRLLRVEGFADQRGRRERNLALSQRRADSVAASLSREGVEAWRLDAVGYGPLPGRSAAIQAQNRRVQFVVELSGDEASNMDLRPWVGEWRGQSHVDLHVGTHPGDVYATIRPGAPAGLGPAGSRQRCYSVKDDQGRLVIHCSGADGELSMSVGRDGRGALLYDGASGEETFSWAGQNRCSEGQDTCTREEEDSFCVDHQSDAAHCGACFRACEGGQACAGGECVGSGSVRISLSWDRPGDMDLHVQPARGAEIYYGHRREGGGFLDRDDTSGTGPENIFWSEHPPAGTYLVCVNPFSLRGATQFTLRVHRAGYATRTYRGRNREGHGNERCTRQADSFVAAIEIPPPPPAREAPSEESPAPTPPAISAETRVIGATGSPPRPVDQLPVPDSPEPAESDRVGEASCGDGSPLADGMPGSPCPTGPEPRVEPPSSLVVNVRESRGRTLPRAAVQAVGRFVTALWRHDATAVARFSAPDVAWTDSCAEGVMRPHTWGATSPARLPPEGSRPDGWFGLAPGPRGSPGAPMGPLQCTVLNIDITDRAVFSCAPPLAGEFTMTRVAGSGGDGVALWRWTRWHAGPACTSP